MLGAARHMNAMMWFQVAAGARSGLERGRENSVAERQRRHPDAILVRVKDATGFGFTYLSEGDFDLAADHFLLPAVQYSGTDAKDPAQRRTLAYDFLWRYFAKPHAKEFFRENIRWIVAAAAREKFREEAELGRVPRVMVIERRSGDDGIVIRAAPEYLDHPGFPLAVIVGKHTYGGGPAHFFDSAADYAKVGQSKPSQETWLPQIIFRLYDETPSVVMGMPKSGKGGDLGVECTALAFGGTARLRERKSEKTKGPPRR